MVAVHWRRRVERGAGLRWRRLWAEMAARDALPPGRGPGRGGRGLDPAGAGGLGPRAARRHHRRGAAAGRRPGRREPAGRRTRLARTPSTPTCSGCSTRPWPRRRPPAGSGGSTATWPAICTGRGPVLPGPRRPSSTGRWRARGLARRRARCGAVAGPRRRASRRTLDRRRAGTLGATRRDPGAGARGAHVAGGRTAVADRVILHVGAPKTGTSFLQDRLFHNPEVLAAQGIRYPADRADAQFLAALDLMQLTWGGLEKQAGGAWDRLAEGGARLARHRDRQPRDPRLRLPRPCAPRAGVVGRARWRHRGARGPVRARPRPADPGRVAGERQAPAARDVRRVPRPDPRPRPREHAGVLVLGRPGGARDPRPLGRVAPARAGARGDRAAPGRAARPALGAVHGRPGHRADQSGRGNRPRRTRRSAYPRRRSSAGSTNA